MRLSEDNVIKVCEMIQAGYSVREITNSTEIRMVVINRIKRRATFQYLSNNYKWV